MNRLISILSLCLLFSSCTNSQRQLDNEKNILGDWVKVRKTHKYNPNSVPVEVPELPDFYAPGFTFYPDHTFDNKLGYFKDGYHRTVYLGTNSKFKISGDSLALFWPDSSKWYHYKLVKLTVDSLQFDFEGAITTFKHFLIKKNQTPQFDKIVIATSGCFGSCIVSNTIINSDGVVIFKGQYNAQNKGLFTGKVSKEKFQQLQDNFRKTNFDSLENSYRSGWTDDQTITTTFVKDGKIYKSVSDYGRRAPYLFTWAYIPLEYLYQTIPLNDNKYTGPIPGFDSVSHSYLKKNGMDMILKKSETFLLFDYLRTGKISSNNFKPRFKLHIDYDLITSLYDVDTDGRYYKFIVNGKPVTIDIGFNFYDVNTKNWVWRKAGEYD
jgi:hypothetical protein